MHSHHHQDFAPSSSEIWVLHGPNLNLLGTREPAIYGKTTLPELNDRLEALAKELGYTLRIEQRNAESELIELIHQNSGKNFVILNPAGLTHTSIVLRDALTGTGTRFIEVHLSNIYAREPFRHHSYFSEIAVGTISGFGAKSYELALQAASDFLKQSN